MDSPLLVGEEGDESIVLSIFNTDIVRQILDGSHEMSSEDISTLNDLVEFQAKQGQQGADPIVPKGVFGFAISETSAVIKVVKTRSVGPSGFTSKESIRLKKRCADFAIGFIGADDPKVLAALMKGRPASFKAALKLNDIRAEERQLSVGASMELKSKLNLSETAMRKMTKIFLRDGKPNPLASQAIMLHRQDSYQPKYMEITELVLAGGLKGAEVDCKAVAISFDDVELLRLELDHSAQTSELIYGHKFLCDNKEIANVMLTQDKGKGAVNFFLILRLLNVPCANSYRWCAPCLVYEPLTPDQKDKPKDSLANWIKCAEQVQN